MSSKATKEKALDTGDTHWSGVVKGGDFTATFTDADKVGSKTTLPFGKVCVCHIFETSRTQFEYGRTMS